MLGAHPPPALTTPCHTPHLRVVSTVVAPVEKSTILLNPRSVQGEKVACELFEREHVCTCSHSNNTSAPNSSYENMYTISTYSHPKNSSSPANYSCGNMYVHVPTRIIPRPRILRMRICTQCVHIHTRRIPRHACILDLNLSPAPCIWTLDLEITATLGTRTIQ